MKPALLTQVLSYSMKGSILNLCLQSNGNDSSVCQISVFTLEKPLCVLTSISLDYSPTQQISQLSDRESTHDPQYIGQ